MILLDSNIIIYSSLPDYDHLRAMIGAKNPSVSEISKLEVLGYHKLGDSDANYFSKVFEELQVLSITPTIIEEAIVLWRSKAMSVGDALIASTAIVGGYELYTANTSDFRHIRNLEVINPLS